MERPYLHPHTHASKYLGLTTGLGATHHVAHVHEVDDYGTTLLASMNSMHALDAEQALPAQNPKTPAATKCTSSRGTK